MGWDRQINLISRAVKAFFLAFARYSIFLAFFLLGSDLCLAKDDEEKKDVFVVEYHSNNPNQCEILVNGKPVYINCPNAQAIAQELLKVKGKHDAFTGSKHMADNALDMSSDGKRFNLQVTNPSYANFCYTSAVNFYKSLGPKGVDKDQLNAFRSKIDDANIDNLKEHFFGTLYDSGGSSVEMVVLTGRLIHSMKAVEESIKATKAELGGNLLSLKQIFLGFAGKCLGKNPRSLAFPTDIDLYVMSNDDKVAKLIKKNFDGYNLKKLLMSSGAVDSVFTVHGYAGPEVYIGWWSKNFIDNINTGNVYRIRSNDSTRDTVNAKDALVIIECEKRSSKNGATKTKAGKYKSLADSEPGLSLENARHLIGEIKAHANNFDALSLIVKACKYFERSNSALRDAGMVVQDPDLTKFADDMIKLEKGVNGERDMAGQVDAIREFIGGAEMAEVKISSDGKCSFELKKQAMNLLLRCEKAIRKNADFGLKTRLDRMKTKKSDIDQESDAKEKDAKLEDFRNEMKTLIDMVETEYEAFKHDKLDLPPQFENLRAELLKLNDGAFAGTKLRKITPSELEEFNKLQEHLNKMCNSGKKASRLLATAILIDKINKGIASGANFLDVVDDSLLGALREDQCSNEWLFSLRQKIQNSETLKKWKLNKAWDTGKLKHNSAVSCVRDINTRLNNMIQSSKAGQMTTKGLAVWNIANELSNYSKSVQNGDWRQLATDVFSSRVPFGSAIEKAVAQEDLWGAGWDIVVTIIPPLGMPQAILGVIESIDRNCTKFYWTSKYDLFRDKLFDSAKFKISDSNSVKNVGDLKLAKWTLVSVKYKYKQEQEKVIPADKIYDDIIDRGWEVEEILRNTVISCDPVFESLNNMVKDAKGNVKSAQVILTFKDILNNKALGDKFKDVVLTRLYQRRENLKKEFTSKLISDMESRFGAEFIELTGNVDTLKSELNKVAEDLDIKERMSFEMENEDFSDSSNFVTAFIWNNARFWKGESATVKSNYQKGIEIGQQYLTAYDSIREKRANLEKTFSLDPRSDSGIRALTGTHFLTGKPENDQQSVGQFVVLMNKIYSQLHAKLIEIKEKAIPNAKLDSDFDLKIFTEAAKHRAWQQIFSTVFKNHQKLDYFKEKMLHSGAVVRTTEKRDAVDQATRDKAHERAKFHDQKMTAKIKEFEEYYSKMRPVPFTVDIKWQDSLDADKKKPVTNAIVTLTAKDGQYLTPQTLPKDEEVPGVHKAMLLPGDYELKIKASGFKTQDGVDELLETLTLKETPIEKDKPEEVKKTFLLLAAKGILTIKVVDKLNHQPVPQAKIKLTPELEDYKDFQIAESDGSFIFKDLPPNVNYQVEVKADNYKGPIQISGLVVDNAIPENSTGEKTVELEPILYNVTIKVVDKKNSPITEAKVLFNEKSNQTSEVGETLFSAVRPTPSASDGYSLKIEKDGFSTLEKSLKIPDPSQSGQALLFTYVLIPGGEIKVKVVDETGKPVTGAQVFLEWETQSPPSEDSDSKGECEFRELAAAEYWVYAQKTGFVNSGEKARVMVTPSNPSPPPVTLKLTQGIKVKVWAWDGKGPVSAGTRISMDGQDKNAANGTAEFIVQTGEHVFKVQARGYCEQEKRLTIDASSSSNIYITIWPEVTLTVKVTDATSKDMIPATLVLSKAGEEISTQTGSAVIFSNLKRGECQIKATAEGYDDYTQKVMINPEKGLNQDLSVSLKKSLGSLSVAVSGFEGENPKEAININVGGRSAKGLSASFADLAAGTYKVSASADGYDCEPVSVEFKPPSKSVSVTLKKKAVDGEALADKDEDEAENIDLEDLNNKTDEIIDDEEEDDKAEKIDLAELNTETDKIVNGDDKPKKDEDDLDVPSLDSDDDDKKDDKKDDNDLDVPFLDSDDDKKKSDSDAKPEDDKKGDESDLDVPSPDSDDDKKKPDGDSKPEDGKGNDDDGSGVDVGKLENMDEKDLEDNVRGGEDELAKNDKDDDLEIAKLSGDSPGADDVLDAFNKMREEEKKVLKKRYADILLAEGKVDIEPFVEHLKKFARKEISSGNTLFNHAAFSPGKSWLTLKINRKNGEVTGQANFELKAQIDVLNIFSANAKGIYRPSLTGTFHQNSLNGETEDLPYFMMNFYMYGAPIGKMAEDADSLSTKGEKWHAELKQDDVNGELTLRDGKNRIPLNFDTKIIEGVSEEFEEKIDRDIAIAFEKASKIDSSGEFDGWAGGKRNQFKLDLNQGTLLIQGKVYIDGLRRFGDNMTIERINNVDEYRFASGGIENLSNAGYAIYASGGELHYLFLGLSKESSYGSNKVNAQPVILQRGMVTSDYQPGSMRLSAASRAAKIFWRDKNGDEKSAFIKKYGGLDFEW